MFCNSVEFANNTLIILILLGFCHIFVKTKHIIMNSPTVLSPESVCKAVSLDLRSQGITHEAAGKAIGKTRVAVSNILYRRKYFSKKMAELFSSEFGYNVDFLMHGKGELISEEENDLNSKALVWSDDPSFLSSALDILEALLRVSGNKELILAWSSYKNRDYDCFLNHLHNAEKMTNINYDLPDSVTMMVCFKSRVEKIIKVKSPNIENDLFDSDFLR